MVRRSRYLVLVAALLCACSAPSPVTGAPTPTIETSEPNLPPRGVCPDKDSCFRVEENQWVKIYRKAGSQGFVLVDPGGPGTSPGAEEEMVGSLPSWLQNFTAVALIEPWVTFDLFPGCKEVFADLSWSRQTSGAKTDSCADEVGRFSQPELRGVVRQVQEHLGQPFNGVVTYSFGATRTRSVWDMVSPTGSLVVVQPAPAPGTPITVIAQARAQAAWSAIEKLLYDSCDDRCSQNVSRLQERLRQGRVTSAQGDLSTRELALFILGAVTQPSRYKDILQALVDGEALPSPMASEVRRVALSVARTSSTTSALKSNVGFRAQMCQAYGPAPQPRAGLGDPIRDAFLAQVGVCGDPFRWSPDDPASLPSRVCVLVGSSDPVAPTVLQTAALSGLPARDQVRYSSSGHTWPASLVAGLRLADKGGREGCVPMK